MDDEHANMLTSDDAEIRMKAVKDKVGPETCIPADIKPVLEKLIVEKGDDSHYFASTISTYTQIGKLGE